MFLTCNHFAVIYKNKAESLFTSLPPFIIIEDLRIYRVFFTHSNLHGIVLSTFEKFMIFENLLAGSSNIPLSSMLRIEKILYRRHFLYKRFIRNLCLLILRLWHFHDFHLQALQIKHLHLHFSLPSHQQFQSSEIGKRHLYLFP